MKINRKILDYTVFALPLLLAAVCLAWVTTGSLQALLPIPMPQEFVGEYSRDGETWQPLTEDAPLSALEGDLLLRGHFAREMTEGVELCFYRNHIGVSISADGELLYADEIAEARRLNTELFASMCAREWMSLSLPELTADSTIAIRLHNPHKAGNPDAYREFLTTLCAKPLGSDILEKNLDTYGNPHRIIGWMLAAASLMLLGASVAAAAVRVPVVWMLLRLGFLTLFAAGFMHFDTVDISFHSELNALNTYGRQLSMMLAVFCMEHFLSDGFTGRKQRAAKAAVPVSAVFNGVLIFLSFGGATVIFDTLPYWAASQILLCALFLPCCAMELRRGTGSRLLMISGMLLLSAMLLDFAGVGSSILRRAPWSKGMFLILFAVHIIAGAKNVVINHRASLRAARLEKELEDSRIAIMLSQIKPHFLYNVLNSIYHLYRKEPETAQEAVNSFAEYLRCNMLSIEKQAPIPFREEYQHIQTYLSLEQIRFRGRLDVVYDVEVSDFRLPPLTVEPLVENAVKHGVTKRRGGGIVTISTRRTEDSFVVSVADTGVGFDTDNYMADGKPHVGIRNVRKRLQDMMGGTLSITSSPDGTVAVVTIPAKEAAL